MLLHGQERTFFNRCRYVKVFTKDSTIDEYHNEPRFFANVLDSILSARGSCDEVKGLQSYGCAINICTHLHTCIGGRFLFVSDGLGVFYTNHGLSGKSAGTKQLNLSDGRTVRYDAMRDVIIDGSDL